MQEPYYLGSISEPLMFGNRHLGPLSWDTKTTGYSKLETIPQCKVRLRRSASKPSLRTGVHFYKSGVLVFAIRAILFGACIRLSILDRGGLVCFLLSRDPSCFGAPCLVMEGHMKLPGPPKWPKSWTLYCPYSESLFCDIGPLFWALLEVEVDLLTSALPRPGTFSSIPACGVEFQPKATFSRTS